MTRYSEYKESGIGWIGRIPQHWRTLPLWTIATYDDEVLSPKHTNDFEFTYIQIGDVDQVSGYGEGQRFLFSTAPASARRVLRKNDILISTVRTYLRAVCIVKESRQDLIGSTAFCVIRPKEFVSPNFLFRYIESEQFICAVVANSEGVTYPTTKSNVIVRLKIALPPINEQIQIARYLDKQVATIDLLVNKLRKKINLLVEYRAALISHCVTKGLNSKVPLKESGIEWVEEIPKHWEAKRLAVIGRFSKGRGISKGDLSPTGLPCILYGELYTKYDRTVLEPSSRIDKELFETSVKVTRGAFLFTASGETAEDIGKCVLVKCPNVVAIGADATIFHLFESEKFDIDFLSFSFNSDYCQHYKAANSRGEIVVHIYKNQLKDQFIIFPSIHEQIKISNFLNAKESAVDRLIEREERRIALLNEYRQSLISNVVTGKVRAPKVSL